MAAAGYKRIKAQGIVFLFGYDDQNPELLHIYARHLMTPRRALDAWFNREFDDEWNEQHQRWETIGLSEGELLDVFWVWVVKDKLVRIITCARTQEN